MHHGIKNLIAVRSFIWIVCCRCCHLWMHCCVDQWTYSEFASACDVSFSCVCPGKMRHTCKIKPHLENWGTLGKMRHTWKNASHMDKWATLGNWGTLVKMRHTWKSAAYLEKFATLGIMGHTRKNGAHLEKRRHTRKNGAHLEKCATLRTMRHTWNNAANLKKYATLGKMRQTDISLFNYFSYFRTSWVSSWH